MKRDWGSVFVKRDVHLFVNHVANRDLLCSCKYSSLFLTLSERIDKTIIYRFCRVRHEDLMEC